MLQARAAPPGGRRRTVRDVGASGRLTGEPVTGRRRRRSIPRDPPVRRGRGRPPGRRRLRRRHAAGRRAVTVTDPGSPRRRSRPSRGRPSGSRPGRRGGPRRRCWRSARVADAVVGGELLRQRARAGWPRRPGSPPRPRGWPSPSGSSASWVGRARRAYRPVPLLRLTGLRSVPVVSAEGFAGVVTYLLDPDRRL